MKDVYEIITERIVALLEQGVVPWQKPWAGLPFSVHPHMLGHAAGFNLANDGQDTRATSITSVATISRTLARYTELSPDRFKGFWQD